MKKCIVWCLGIILPVISISVYLLCGRIIEPPEAVRCAICDSMPMHAPCIVNLSTGEVGELRIYDPNPDQVATLNVFQQGGTFVFIEVSGFNGYRDTSNWETHITIPADKGKYKKDSFCKQCRSLIEDYSNDGYLLLDLLSPENVSVIDLDPDEGNFLRCYEVKIINKEREQELIVAGNLEIVNHMIQ